MNYGIGEYTTYHGYCTHPDCAFITDDYENEDRAEQEVINHVEIEHGDNGE